MCDQEGETGGGEEESFRDLSVFVKRVVGAEGRGRGEAEG